MGRPSPRHLLPALLVVPTVLAVPALGALSPAPAASAAPPPCFGRSATIVGEGYLVGTPGPDVIVATGTAEVHALGGGDRVCGAFLVYAGPGNDRVSYAKQKEGDYPDLYGGLGADLILLGGNRFGLVHGGPGDDDLRSGRGEQILVGGPGRDRLAGGPGPDDLNGGPERDRGDGGLGDDSCSLVEVKLRC